MKIHNHLQIPGSKVPAKVGGLGLVPTIGDKSPSHWAIVGPPGMLLDGHARALSRVLWPEDRLVYWTEHDYFDDLITLNKLSDRARSDDAIWTDYVDWETNFLYLKNHEPLLIDRMCAGYTSFHWYEAFDLLAYRVSHMKRTIVCASVEDFAATSKSLRGLIQTSFKMLVVDDEGQWPNTPKRSPRAAR